MTLPIFMALSYASLLANCRPVLLRRRRSRRSHRHIPPLSVGAYSANNTDKDRSQSWPWSRPSSAPHFWS